MYLHEMGNEEASFTKEDMQAGLVNLRLLIYVDLNNTVQGSLDSYL